MLACQSQPFVGANACFYVGNEVSQVITKKHHNPIKRCHMQATRLFFGRPVGHLIPQQHLVRGGFCQNASAFQVVQGILFLGTRGTWVRAGPAGAVGDEYDSDASLLRFPDESCSPLNRTGLGVGNPIIPVVGVEGLLVRYQLALIQGVVQNGFIDVQDDRWRQVFKWRLLFKSGCPAGICQSLIQMV